MKPEAASGLIPFLLQCGEGYCDWLYLDIKGNVTIGVGVLLPSVTSALQLDWGSALARDVVSAWNEVLRRRDLMKDGGGAYRAVTSIRASAESLARLHALKAETFEAALRGTFAGFDSAPWQAQLGLMRLAWAMGPHFAEMGRWPNFRRCWAAGDWAGCGAESAIPELDAVEPEANRLLRELFESAAG